MSNKPPSTPTPTPGSYSAVTVKRTKSRELNFLEKLLSDPEAAEAARVILARADSKVAAPYTAAELKIGMIVALRTSPTKYTKCKIVDAAEWKKSGGCVYKVERLQGGGAGRGPSPFKEAGDLFPEALADGSDGSEEET